VLAKNDRVRFKFHTNFSGYLYVTNQSTSGNSSLLFPTAQTGSGNRIEPGKDYLIPATSGAFRVDGPEGHDVVSWTVSPVELGKPPESLTRAPLPESKPDGEPTANMKPRCDDTIFRSRGDCVDTSAGAQPMGSDSKDLIVIREKKSSVISSPVPLTGPVVYEFHLAHR
jgi:hypothetical protein